VWCGFVGSGYASMVSLRLTSRAVDIRPVAILVAAVFRVWAIVAERGRRAADLAAAIDRVSDLQTGAEIGLHVGGDHCAQLVISARADQQSGALPTLEGPARLCEARWCDCAIKCPSPAATVENKSHGRWPARKMHLSWKDPCCGLPPKPGSLRHLAATVLFWRSLLPRPRSTVEWSDRTRYRRPAPCKAHVSLPSNLPRIAFS
jgi:hypothetical protein